MKREGQEQAVAGKEAGFDQERVGSGKKNEM